MGMLADEAHDKAVDEGLEGTSVHGAQRSVDGEQRGRREWRHRRVARARSGSSGASRGRGRPRSDKGKVGRELVGQPGKPQAEARGTSNQSQNITVLQEQQKPLQKLSWNETF